MEDVIDLSSAKMKYGSKTKPESEVGGLQAARAAEVPRARMRSARCAAIPAGGSGAAVPPECRPSFGTGAKSKIRSGKAADFEGHGWNRGGNAAAPQA